MTWIILDELCSSWIFQGYSLFSYQCSLLFSATLICYHIFKRLSTTFFIFQFFWTDVLSFCDSFDILSNPICFVKNFFHFLFRSDSVLCDSLIILSNRQPFVNNYFILSGGVFSSLVCDSLYILANLYLFVNRFFHSFYLFFSDGVPFLYHKSAIYDRDLHSLRSAVLLYHMIFAV